MLIPLRRHTPTRTADGEGGYTETLGEATTFYGALQTHDTRVTVTVRDGSALSLGDIVLAGGAYYTVIGFTGTGRAGYKAALVEKRDRPAHR